MNQVSNKYEKNLYSYSPKATSIMLIIGMSFIAANLRAPLTSVGPLVSLIRDNLHISNTLAGLITTLPLFAFALFSPIVPGMARRFGTEIVLFWSVVILTIGILLRSWSGSFGLFLGTAILGLSISAGNVLIPSLIKKEFPRQVGVMTGVYSVSMNIFATLASGISIPLAVGSGLGWAGALKIWSILSFVSIILWIPQLRRKNKRYPLFEKITDIDITRDTFELHEEIDEINIVRGPVIKKVSMWKSPLAWQVTLYMGLQSMVFYCMVAWLPGILIQQGMAQSIGYLLAALGPIFFGYLHDAANSWGLPLIILIGIAGICLLAGLGASRDLHISAAANNKVTPDFSFDLD